MTSRSHRTAAFLRGLALVVGLLFSSEAYMARHADYVKRSLVVTGPVAREIVVLLGLDVDRPGTLVLELPEGMEHFEAMAMHRVREGSSLAADRPSQRLAQRLVWDPRRGELSLGEHWYDQVTALPHAAGPRYVASSPLVKDEVAATGAWAPVYRALRPKGPLVRAAKDFTVSSELRLRLELLPWNGKLVLMLAVGPWLEDSGCSHGRE